MQTYRELVAWQKAMSLVEQIYAVTREMPPEERFGLTSQMRRAAVSMPSNLAEGHARESTKEFVRYIAIARGSLAELESQLELAARLNMVHRDHVSDVLSDCDELGRILRGLRKSLDKKLSSPLQ